MPAVKRIVEPIYVSRGPIPKGVKNELEAVAVNTLSGVIQQLSSLAKHAEDIFGELFTEAMQISTRCSVAQDRIDRLSVKVTQLDSAGEEISLQDINMQKAFKMTIHSDQQVVSRKTLPESMQYTYGEANPVPDLNRLNKFRSDDKEALQFYTHPGYFFELWLEKMSKEFESKKKKKKRGNRAKRDETKAVRQVKQREKKPNVPDWEIRGTSKQKTTVEVTASTATRNDMPPDDYKPTRADSGLAPSQERYVKRMSSGAVVGRPPSAPPPPPPPSGVEVSVTRTPSVSPPPPPPPPPSQLGGPAGDVDFPPPPPSMTGMVSPPPPPPPPPPTLLGGDAGHDLGLPLPPPLQTSSMPPPPPPSMVGAPMPPPPPPPPMAAGGVAPPPPPPAAGGISAALLSQHNLKAAAPPPPPPTAEEAEAEDDRSDLLAAIRKGMHLKKVQERKLAEKKEDKSQPMDVASILARRIAMEISDSEDEGDDDSDDDGWSDDD